MGDSGETENTAGQPELENTLHQADLDRLPADARLEGVEAFFSTSVQATQTPSVYPGVTPQGGPDHTLPLSVNPTQSQATPRDDFRETLKVLVAQSQYSTGEVSSSNQLLDGKMATGMGQLGPALQQVGMERLATQTVVMKWFPMNAPQGFKGLTVAEVGHAILSIFSIDLRGTWALPGRSGEFLVECRCAEDMVYLKEGVLQAKGLVTWVQVNYTVTLRRADASELALYSEMATGRAASAIDWGQTMLGPQEWAELYQEPAFQPLIRLAQDDLVQQPKRPLLGREAQPLKPATVPAMTVPGMRGEKKDDTLFSEEEKQGVKRWWTLLGHDDLLELEKDIRARLLASGLSQVQQTTAQGTAGAPAAPPRKRPSGMTTLSGLDENGILRSPAAPVAGILKPQPTAPPTQHEEARLAFQAKQEAFHASLLEAQRALETAEEQRRQQQQPPRDPSAILPAGGPGGAGEPGGNPGGNGNGDRGGGPRKTGLTRQPLRSSTPNQLAAAGGDPDSEEEEGVNRKSLRPPKLKTFTGRDPERPGQVSYEHWSQEVRWKRLSHEESAIMSAIPASLTGAAQKAFHSTETKARQMGQTLSLDGLLQIFDKFYGVVHDSAVLMSVFHNIEQRPDENAAELAARVQEEAGRVNERVGRIALDDRDIRRRFYYGLNAKDRSAISHAFWDDSVDFNALLVHARMLEDPEGHRSARKTGRERWSRKSYGARAEEPHSESDEEDTTLSLKALHRNVEGLQAQLADYFCQGAEARQDRKPDPRKKDVKCFGCGDVGHFVRECPKAPEDGRKGKGGKKGKSGNWKGNRRADGRGPRAQERAANNNSSSSASQ